MTETKTNAGVAGAQATPKKSRRGVNNKTQAVSQLKFHEKDSAQNYLFVGHLEEVRVDWSTNEDNKDFPGTSIPHLTIHFASNHQNASEKRHVYQTLFPVPSNVNTIPDGSEEWRVNNIFNWIKHILDVFYLKGRELTEAEEAALSLSFDDIDDEGNYVSVDVEEVVAGYRILFDNTCAMLNGTFSGDHEATGKPVYKTADGKFIPCWLKLLRHKRRKGEWINVTSNGDLGFDSFIGNGVVELMNGQNPPKVLRIDLSKESITPKEVKKTPTIGAPGMNVPGVGGVIAGSMTGMQGMYAPNNADIDAGEEMPF